MSDSATPQQSDELGRLTQQLAELRDLFQRRLLEDKSKAHLIQSVQTSLEARDALDRGEAFRAVFTEILLAIDRLSSETPSADLNASVRAELLEVLSRRGVQSIPATGLVDARLHEVVGTATPAQTDLPEGTIIDIQRPGYVLAGRLLRPAQVVTALTPNTDRTEK